MAESNGNGKKETEASPYSQGQGMKATLNLIERMEAAQKLIENKSTLFANGWRAKLAQRGYRLLKDSVAAEGIFLVGEFTLAGVRTYPLLNGPITLFPDARRLKFMTNGKPAPTLENVRMLEAFAEAYRAKPEDFAEFIYERRLFATDGHSAWTPLHPATAGRPTDTVVIPADNNWLQTKVEVEQDLNAHIVFMDILRAYYHLIGLREADGIKVGLDYALYSALSALVTLNGLKVPLSHFNMGRFADFVEGLDPQNFPPKTAFLNDVLRQLFQVTLVEVFGENPKDYVFTGLVVLIEQAVTREGRPPTADELIAAFVAADEEAAAKDYASFDVGAWVGGG